MCLGWDYDSLYDPVLQQIYKMIVLKLFSFIGLIGVNYTKENHIGGLL